MLAMNRGVEITYAGIAALYPSGVLGVCSRLPLRRGSGACNRPKMEHLSKILNGLRVRTRLPPWRRNRKSIVLVYPGL
jgi:hypothetical protein